MAKITKTFGRNRPKFQNEFPPLSDSFRRTLPSFVFSVTFVVTPVC